ncbi:MAG TPA: uroporphyrinogen-III synthase [Terriglobales bacterium]|jgi:uroporphyrinogen-III synthase
MKAPARKNKPLAGLRVLVGRARHQASALSAGLQALGADVIEVPFIEIRPPRSYATLDAALKRAAEYDWLILTSVNGVDALAARMKRLRIGAQNLKHLQIAAIGPATRDKIEELGLHVTLIPQRYVAESVVDSLRGMARGKRILLARAKVARDVIPRELRKLGATVDVVEAYETVVPAGSRKMLQGAMSDSGSRPHVVCFTSSSTVRNFVKLIGGRGRPPHTGLADVRFASMGPITSATLRELGLSIHIEAEEYTIPGLIEAIKSAR